VVDAPKNIVTPVQTPLMLLEKELDPEELSPPQPDNPAKVEIKTTLAPTLSSLRLVIDCLGNVAEPGKSFFAMLWLIIVLSHLVAHGMMVFYISR